MVVAGKRRHYLVGTYIIIRPEYYTLYSEDTRRPRDR